MRFPTVKEFFIVKSLDKQPLFNTTLSISYNLIYPSTSDVASMGVIPNVNTALFSFSVKSVPSYDL